MRKCPQGCWLLVTFLLASCSGKDDATIRKVDTLMEVREYGKALDILQSALQENKHSKKLLRERVVLLLQAERVDLAFAAYKELTESVSPQDPVLIQSLSSSSPTVRANAARVLVLTGDPRALEALTRALEDPSDDVRRAAVDAMGNLKTKDATPALLHALGDSWWFVRSEAAVALEKTRTARRWNLSFPL